jgi:hypothetical protein
LTLGEYQADDYKSHNHPISVNGGQGQNGTSGNDPGNVAKTQYSNYNSNQAYIKWGDLSGSSTGSGGNETRPVNVALLACIKL